ncbi:MAG: transposase [Candidatus Cloacimonetes bacterium]|nr:transposase [Candidatus Cloacimonadota bacterium]
MLRSKEIEVSQKVQVKFLQFTEKLTKSLSIPEQKFIRDVMRGILSSQSCILRRLSQSLKEGIDLKKVCKRLTYHLDKTELLSQVTDSNIQSVCRSFNKDTLIIVDPSDIAKKCAKQMEGLSRVRNGDKKEIVNGYETLNILAVNKHEQELSLKPVISELFSYSEEIDTLKNILFDHLGSIIISSDNKGVYVLDRAYDDKKMYLFFSDNIASYIIRSNAIRDMYYNEQKLKFKEIAKKVNLSHTFKIERKTRKGKTKIETVYAGVMDVKIPVDPHPLKNPTLVSAKLFVGKYKNGGYWYLLFSLPNHMDLSESELVEFVFRAYKIRWKIEETHRHIKQDFKWEEIRLAKYDRLKLLNAIFWISIGFLYSLQSLKYHFIKAFHYLMLDKKKKTNKISEFLFYRVTLVVDECFTMISNRVICQI